MGRKRTGTAYPHLAPDGRFLHWDAKVTRPGPVGPDGKPGRGKRGPTIHLEWMTDPNDRAGAEAEAARLSAVVDARALPLDAKGRTVSAETFGDWSDRWIADRRARGLASVGDDEGRLDKWIKPHLGDKPIATIVRRDVEALVERLDKAARAHAAELAAGRKPDPRSMLSWKTAANVWGLVSKAFDDATNAKTLALRVLAENPAAGVRGPDRGASRARAYLYPSEALRLLSCERVPLRWRRAYALTMYTYTRASEALALDASDVDFEGGTILVHKALDKKGKVKATKTKETRRIPIEPELDPLLRVLVAEAAGGRLVSLPRKKVADELREHLLRAGVTRAELHASDATRKALTFHDAGRATGITWMAIRGDDPLRIQRRAGHARFDTTEGYIREAEALGRNVGQPFPPLPASLLASAAEAADGDEEAAESSAELSGEDATASNVSKLQRECRRGGRDSNPRRRSAAARGSHKSSDVSSEAGSVGEALECHSDGSPDDSRTLSEPSGGHRGRLARALAEAVADALAAGDAGAARVALDALERLTGELGEAAPVVDLAAERRRRGES